MRKGDFQWAGFWLAGLLCVALTAVKLVFALPWSWWRVLLPVWAVLWHNTVYIEVGFIWLTWMGCRREGDDLRVRRRRKLDRYQFGSIVCALIFVDNVLRKMGGPGESVWWWLASGRIEVIMLSGGLMLACQFVFWSKVIGRKDPMIRNRQRGR